MNYVDNRQKTNHTKDLRNLISTKTESSYQTSPASKKALDTDQESSDTFEVIWSSDHQARAHDHGRQEKQVSVAMAGHLQVTSKSDKSKDERSSTSDDSTQYVDKVTRNPIFIPFAKYTPRSPEGQRKKSKMTKEKMYTWKDGRPKRSLGKLCSF